MSPVGINTTPLLVELSAQELRRRLTEALAIYVEAMDYPKGTEFHRAPMWTEHTHRPGWRAVAAVLPAGDDPATATETETMVGIAYGYRGAPHQWWHQQVREGMYRSGADERRIHEVLGDYFELTELHVSREAQGHRTGEALLRKLLEGRTESHVLLSTPEVEDEDNRAWRLYRRLGFTDVVRHFTFTGDNRPFAVLGRLLPLPSDGAENAHSPG
ncbi:GNAT family N-acetyltransferase [Rhodococcus daqingensis]|uniref:GNAT family N-acetyltransferase n=1 Tax=Rhodococcus daqingensis TaxID=2479363 RepID=A0ABW2RTK7_9NOCA